MKATISQQVVFPRLFLYSEENYRGRRFVWRGNVGIRNLERLYDDHLIPLFLNVYRRML